MSAEARPEAIPVGGPPLPDVLEEHMEEIGFLSIQRRKLLFSPSVPLRRFPRHDARIEAHRDGLLLGGTATVKIALERMEQDDPWQVCAAVQVWIEVGRPETAAVMEKLATLEGETPSAWREAFRRSSRETVARIFPSPAGGSPDAPALSQALMVDAWAWHEALSAATLQTAAAHPALEVRSAAARALSLMEPAGWRAELFDRLGSDADPGVRARAVWALALRDPAAGLARCRQSAGSGPDAFPLRVLGLLGGKQDLELLTSALRVDGPEPAERELAAIAAIGDLGEKEGGPVLLKIIEEGDEARALAATEAFEVLAGSIPPPEQRRPPSPASAGPNPASPGPAREHWEQTISQLPRGSRMLRGLSFPWDGRPEDEPMEAVWRSSIRAARVNARWLRREVPDGFFTALPSTMANPGE